MREKGFTLIELLATTAIILVLATVSVAAGWKVYEASSLAISANNIRQLAAGGAGYLTDHSYVYWPYRKNEASGIVWWWGLEPWESTGRPEGERDFDAEQGPLAGYVAKGFRPDPSFALGGNAFKPKYRNGYIGIGYNVVVGGDFLGTASRLTYWQLSDPSRVVIFSTSAQVNDFQAPAGPGNPKLEEFYALDAGNGRQAKYPNIHFRHHGKAMVAFASGNAGFLEMDESTRDKRMPNANVGRLAPAGSTLYLK